MRGAGGGLNPCDFTPNPCDGAEKNSLGTFRQRAKSGSDEKVRGEFMIRKLKAGGYRLYSRKRNPATGKRRNLGTFNSLEAATRHERQVQFFKRQ